MGSYLNPGNFAFRKSLNSKIYVDGVAEAVTQSKKLLESLWELDGSVTGLQ